jgi:hypothetical protein
MFPLQIFLYIIRQTLDEDLLWLWYGTDAQQEAGLVTTLTETPPCEDPGELLGNGLPGILGSCVAARGDAIGVKKSIVSS